MLYIFDKTLTMINLTSKSSNGKGAIFGIAIVLLVGCGLMGCSKRVSIPSPPVRIPFNLSDSHAYLETQINITDFRNYLVGFEFSFDSHSSGQREDVRKRITDGDSDKLNGSMNIQFEIHAIGTSVDVIEYSKNIETYRIFSIGKSTINAEFGRAKLKPGIYKLILKNQASIERLHTIPTYFILASDPKSRSITD